MRAIAKAIDYSPAGLYEYFGSKEEIVGAVVNEGFDRFTRHLQQVDLSLSAEEYMVELGMAYIDFAIQNPDFYLLMFTTVPLTPIFQIAEEGCAPKEMLAEQPSFRIVLDGVSRCIQAGIFQTTPDFDAFEMAYAFWGLGHGISMLRVAMLNELPLDYETVDRGVLQVMLNGMQTRDNR